jgi:hypothetical protein
MQNTFAVPESLAAKAVRFEQTFGVKLAKFWDGPLRLNIIEFDERIVQSPDGESCAQAIERRWGPDALALVRSLL